jgi:hypothetical protein
VRFTSNAARIKLADLGFRNNGSAAMRPSCFRDPERGSDKVQTLLSRLHDRVLKGLVLAAGLGAGIAGGLGVVGSEAAGYAVSPLAGDRIVVAVQAEKTDKSEKAEKPTQKSRSNVKVRRFTPCGPGASIDGCKPSN